MKRSYSSIYYIIPIVYIAAIAFFLYMQFHSRERFQDRMGALEISGTYTKSLSGGKQIRDITVSCNGIPLRFGRQPVLLIDPGPAKSRRIRVLSYSMSEQGLELACSDEVRLRFSLKGELGSTVVLAPLLPDSLKAPRVLSLPFFLREDKGEAVRGIPLLRVSGRLGIRYAALPAGSAIDLKKNRLEIGLWNTETEQEVQFARVEKAQDEPYLYWFSRENPLADEEQYSDRLEQYLERAYRYWNRVIEDAPADPSIAGGLGVCLLSEAVRHGEYRRLLPAVSAAIRQARQASPAAASSYAAAAYLGYLQGFLSSSQQEAAGLIQRITEQIRRSDPAVLDTPELMRFIVNRAPFSLAEEVLRLADGVDRSKASNGTLLSLLEAYVGAARFFDSGTAVKQRMAELIDRWLLPSVLQTREGLFLASPTGEQEGRVDLSSSVRAGRLFVQASSITSRPSLGELGRNLILAALALADLEGFVPAGGDISAGRFRAGAQRLSPEKLYPLVAETRYLPEEYPLFAYLSPGAWLYTASIPNTVKSDPNQLRFTFSFPPGNSYYFLVQGLKPMQSVMLHEIPWKPDPEYSLYTDGWVYDEEGQTLFGKITHRKPDEELVINY